MNKRLALLEKLVNAGQADAFARYGLAMEYRSEGRLDDALAQFSSLRATDPGYVPQYLMTGQVLVGLGRVEEAKAILNEGIAVARKAGNSHAISEMESVLAGLDP